MSCFITNVYTILQQVNIPASSTFEEGSALQRFLFCNTPNLLKARGTPNESPSVLLILLRLFGLPLSQILIGAREAENKRAENKQRLMTELRILLPPTQTTSPDF